jgi:hypothetical protein
MAAAAIPVAYYVALLAALVLILIWQQTFGTPEKAAQAGRAIQRALDEIADLFKGQPLPEDLDRAKREAEEALERAREKLPKPDPKPGPFPIPPPNLGPDPYERDRKREECERKRRQYRWGPHREVSRPENIRTVNGIPEQSHHIVQHAHFSANRSPGNGLSSICPDYNINDAPALPVVGGTRFANSPHARITEAQRAVSDSYAQRFRATGVRPAYGESLTEGMGQIAQHTDLRGDPVALACLLEYVMEYFQRTCPSINGTTPLRIPFMNPADAGP